MTKFNDDTMRPEMEALKEIAKQNHAERVAKTPDRIRYAEEQFKLNNIKYILKNSSNGHFHCFDSNGNLFQFWCSTGKIFYDYKVEQARQFKKSCREYRGIDNLIKLLVVEDYTKLKKQIKILEKALELTCDCFYNNFGKVLEPYYECNISSEAMQKHFKEQAKEILEDD